MEKWNFQKVGMPEFDGQYLCYISQKQECGNVLEYQRVVQCSNNKWIIVLNEEIFAWKKLENPLLENKAKSEIIDVLTGLVSDVATLLSDEAIEWQQAGYFNEAKRLLKNLRIN